MTIKRLSGTCKACGSQGISNKATGQAALQMRTQAGLTQGKLAKKLGWSQSYLALLENGRREWTWEKIVHFEKVVEKMRGIV